MSLRDQCKTDDVAGWMRLSDSQAARIAALEAALLEAMCPSAMIDNKDETVGYCVEHHQCGCGMQAMGLAKP